MTPDTTTPHGGAPTLDAMAAEQNRQMYRAQVHAGMRPTYEAEWPHNPLPAAPRNPVPQPSVTGPMLEVMASRLSHRLNWTTGASYRARDAVAYALTGIAMGGPERDAAVAAALSRLSGPAADAPGVPAGVVRDYRAASDEWRIAYDAWNKREDSPQVRAAYDRMLIARAALNAALSTLPAAAGGDPTPAAEFDDREDRSEPTTPEAILAVAAREAESLAIILHRKHFPEVTQWRPLTGDVRGLLSQIDNMVSGLVEPTPAVGGVALPGVEEIAEALFYTADCTNKDAVWADLVADKAMVTSHFVRSFRAQATALRARIADHQARPAAPEGVPTGVAVEIDYTNYRGERSTRTVIPTGRLLPGDATYHPTARWVAEAWDVEKAAMRTFDLAHVHAWGDQKPQGSAAVFRASLAAAKTAVADAGPDPAALDAGDGGAAAGDERCPSDEQITIVARSIGRTMRDPDHGRRAQDVFRSLRERDLTRPSSPSIPTPPTTRALQPDGARS